MKIVLAGACGNLGGDIFRSLLAAGHTVVAADVIERDLGLAGDYTFRKLDVTDPAALKGLCDGADMVISTVGLTKASATLTSEQIDFAGNRNLLREAQAAGVKKFIYISVLKADRGAGVPMVEKGSVSLLGDGSVRANVIDTPDFADYITAHLDDPDGIVSIGGRETYTYAEIARMCFAAAGKPAVIRSTPAWLFDVLAFVSRCRRNGKEAVIRFGKWTMTRDMTADVHAGEHSFAEYIKKSF